MWTDGCAQEKCEDVPTDDPPDEDETDDEPEGLEDDSSAAWEHETRQVERKLEMQTSLSSSLARPRGEAELSQRVENTPMQAEQHVRKVSQNPTKFPKQESRAVFLSMDVTSSASQQKRFVNRPGQFVASQLRKREVEVSVNNLFRDKL